ncbi:MAG: hypothetical protein Q8K07_14280 [Methylicorpusculum sp.]|uniref:ArnT family glycosyltransferase n=1 Tax=Methylicorpusculum sp. TaxID=2713644 RepID=UPI00272FFBEF|nr:hypothetical protein [Methylicorpusculum sp.]MDP2203188.1 hypothetical protein [Methylicorpusculum sp.]
MWQIQSPIILLSIIFGVAATLWGGSQMSWPAALPGAWDLYSPYLYFLVVVAVVLCVFSSWLKVNRIVTASVVAFAISIVTGTIWALVVTIWFGLASYALGFAILVFFKFDKEKLSNITAALVGAGVYGTAVGIAAHFPINYPGLYGFALAVPILFGWRDIYAAVRSLGQFCGEKSVSKWHDLAIALVALIHFSVSLMPEVGHDALAMHLFIPAHLRTRHEWGYDVNTYVWAVMPMMGDWLFSIGYMLAEETAARLINVGFIFVLGWLIRDLVIWAGGSAIGARWAVLLFLTTPLTFTESSSLFIESVWAAFVVAGSLSVFKLLQRSDDHSDQLLTAGILLGSGVAAKAVTFTILPVLALFLISRYRIWGKREFVTAIGKSLLLFLLIGGVPYVTAWHITGNPVFPFFNQIFKSPFFPEVAFEAPAVFLKGLTWDVIYKATFHTEQFLEGTAGAPGFQWILLFLPSLLMLIACRGYRGLVLLVVAGCCIVVTFQSLAYLRYIFPSFAWGAAGIGVALSVVNADLNFVRKILSIAGVAVVLLNLVLLKSGTNYGNLSHLLLIGQFEKEAYLNSSLPIRIAVQLVNQLNVGRTPVAIFSSPLTAGLNSDALYPNWYNLQFDARVKRVGTKDHIANLLMEKGVDFVILDSSWGDPEKREVIEGVTDKIHEQGSIIVRKLKENYRFQNELLKSTDFSSYEGWELTSDTLEQRPGRVAVSVSSPASQLVSVLAGRRYQNSVTAYCKDQPTQGRVQVNWLDAKSNFISTDIKVFDCTPTAKTHAMEVTAPLGAAKAAVYATGHASIPIIFSEVSFKQ